LSYSLKNAQNDIFLGFWALIVSNSPRLAYAYLMPSTFYL